MGREKFIILIISFLLCSVLKGQDPIFSIFKIDDTYLNPANTFNHLLEEETILKLNLHFRDQWTKVSNGDTYTTVKVQGDYNFYKSDLDGFNGGIIFLNDRSSNGGFTNTGLQILGSYTRLLADGGRSYGSHILTVGSSFTFAQTRTSLDKIWFGRQFNLNSNVIDLSLTSGEEFRIESFNYNDLNIGARWMFIEDQNNYFMAGLSLNHMNNPTISSLNTDFSISTRYVVQAEASLEMNEIINHVPSLLFVKQGQFWQLRPTYHVSIDINNDDESFALLAGVSARVTNSLEGILTDAIIIGIGLKSSSWNFSLNFDANISTLRTFTETNGAIELSFGYVLNSK